MDGGMLKKIAQWSGLLAGVLTFILGIVHVSQKDAQVKWPDSFVDDINWGYWRLPLFTLIPDALCDNWTPLIMGLVGVMVHLQTVECSIVGGSFLNYFVRQLFLVRMFGERLQIFQFFTGMFGTIGYSGGLGILFSIFPFFSALFSLMCFFLDDDRVGLKLRINMKLREGA